MEKIKLLSTNFVKKSLTKDFRYLDLAILQKSITEQLDKEITQNSTNINNKIILDSYCFGPAFLQINGIIFNSANNYPLSIKIDTFKTNNKNTNINFIELINSPLLEENNFSFGGNNYTEEQIKTSFLTKWINTTKNLTVQIGKNFNNENNINKIDNDILYTSLLSQADSPAESNFIDQNYNSLCRGLKINKLILNDKIITGIDCSNLEELTINLSNQSINIQTPLLPNSNLLGVFYTDYLPKKELTVIINNKFTNFNNYLEGLIINNLIYTITCTDGRFIKENDVKNITFDSNSFNKLFNLKEEKDTINYHTINLLSGENLLDNSIKKISFPNLTNLTIEDNIYVIEKELFKYSNKLSEIIIKITESSIKKRKAIIYSKAFQTPNKLIVYFPNIEFTDINIFETEENILKNKINIAIDAFTTGTQLYFKGNVLYTWTNLKEIPIPFKYGDIENYKTYYQLSKMNIYSNDKGGNINE